MLITGDAIITVNVNSLFDLLRHRHGVFGPPWITTWSWPLVQQSIARLGELQPTVVASWTRTSAQGQSVRYVPSAEVERRRPHDRDFDLTSADIRL